MALSFADATNDIRPRHTIGDLVVKLATVTFDSSYVTGGMAITAANFGLNRIIFVSVNAQATVVTKTVAWDQANSKLIVIIDGGTPAEAGNGTDQSALSVQIAVFGY